MAADSKADLLELCRKDYARLAGLLDQIDEPQAMRPEDDVSIKDIAAHRAHWIDLYLNWYADGLAGKQVFFPAQGYKWSDLKRYNADLRQSQSSLGWSDAKAMLGANHARLVAFLESRSESELYGGPMQGAYNQWTPGRWAEAAGPSHFRSASRYIRSRLKQRQGGNPQAPCNRPG